MTALIVDAGALYAQADADEPQHAAVAHALRKERDSLVTSQIVVAEADYLILRRLGIEVELKFLDDLAGGTYVVDALTPPELTIARDVVARYRDLELGLADASLVVLASRWRTRRILTLDERAFRAVTPLQGDSFEILPADGSR
ncbi:MAG TPA: PIN domain-containing protein [Solirubrobacteraceae bacterium]|nr:PIN domain-containing protein [Solirubrobacteraceae bacterium]